MATNVHLTPELERFARQCVETGRYNNVSEVVRSALRMLQDAELQRERFMAMLEEAETEGERDGFFEIDEVAEELDRIIEDAERSRK
ncbi:type II toxin-antitoxin system ParD family antitoxin [Azospirillum sp. TSO22-1]|uniref:type II toxin-antitoxin system ParD family antitoxin n=1 Tax=Azospirillum sp. TSO22-1 TaxID=716789 RepID=UPI000D65B73A|nr:type II toxin-antitoxin system ParD family antitoxin [Azospirillum sp. TSO22-1]